MISTDDLSKAQTWLAALGPLPPEVVAELGRRYDVSLTHHSTAIEGNTLTQSETEIVLEKGITIAGKSVVEHLEVVGHKEALDFVRALADENQPITERGIREIQSLVLKGQDDPDRGAYRTLDVRAAGTGFVYPSHLKAPELMAAFVSWMNEPLVGHPVDFASEAHLRFVTIHPFRDGNGRVGRLLLNLILLRSGYPIAVLPVSQRAEYIGSLESAQASGFRARLDALVRVAVAHSLRETLETALSSERVAALAADRENVLAWLGSQGW